jgi:hypothetical protein
MTTFRNDLTYERASELLSYDPETGLFSWKVRRPGKGASPGVWFAGTQMVQGHLQIRIDRRTYYAHRLAWLLAHGRWPSEQIDHRNGNRADNRLANLRECTHGENQQNRAIGRNNTSGFLGVSWFSPSQKWMSKIRLHGRLQHLGYYDSPEAAHEAYLIAKSRLHEFQPIPRHLIATRQGVAA